MADKRYVVVDGSNLATEGRKVPSLAQLDEAVRAYADEDPDAEIVVVVDASFEHRIDPSEAAQLEQAELHGEVVSPPAGAIGRGDAFVLRIAERTGASVLSNDSFQEFHGEHAWLFDEGRLIGGKPVPGIGWIFTPRTPVRGPKSRQATSKAKSKSKHGPADQGIAPAEKAAELARAARKIDQVRRVPDRNGDGSTPRVGDVWVPPAAALPPRGAVAASDDPEPPVAPKAKRAKKAVKAQAPPAEPKRAKKAKVDALPAELAVEPAVAAPKNGAKSPTAKAGAKQAATTKAAAKKSSKATDTPQKSAKATGSKKAAKAATGAKKAAPAKTEKPAASARATKAGTTKAGTTKTGTTKTGTTKTDSTKAEAPKAGARKAAAPGTAATAAKATKATKATKTAATATKAPAAKKATKAAPAKKAAKSAATTTTTTTTTAAADGGAAEPVRSVARATSTRDTSTRATRTAARAAEEGAVETAAEIEQRLAASPQLRAAIVEATAEAVTPPPPRDRNRSAPNEEIKSGSKKAKRRRRSNVPPPAVNAPLAFINFVAAYPVGSTVEGEVASFTSHGAMVEVGVPDGTSLHCYVPLSGLGHPAPSKARDVVSRGERLEFVLVGLDPPRRVAELALPSVSAALLAAAN